MKFSVISDTHAQHLRMPQHAAEVQMQQVEADAPDFILHLGDIGEGDQGDCPAYKIWLNHPRPVYWVTGNHDLWRSNKLPPDKSHADTLKRFPWGHPLEKHWTDKTTFFKVGRTSIVGSMGFPDFRHPAVDAFDKDYWRKHIATVDGDYIDLSKGWTPYTERLQKAFFARLAKAFAADVDQVVVACHYPFLEAHSCLNMLNQEELRIWPFFFNYTIGQEVLRLAKEHPAKKVFALAGHSHEFCRGRLTMVAENVCAYGFQTVYGYLPHKTFDTDKDIVTLMKEINKDHDAEANRLRRGESWSPDA